MSTQLLASWDTVRKPMHAISCSLHCLMQLGHEKRNTVFSSNIPVVLRGCPGMASALCSAGQAYSLLYFLLLFTFLSFPDISFLHNCTQLLHSKAAPLLRADCTPFTGRYVSFLSGKEAYRPWASRRQNTPCFSACVGISVFSVSFVSLVLLCCTAQGVP